jgi:hypothetical protein
MWTIGVVKIGNENGPSKEEVDRLSIDARQWRASLNALIHLPVLSIARKVALLFNNRADANSLIRCAWCKVILRSLSDFN